MNTELTTQLSVSDSDKLSLILTTVQSLTVRVDNIDSRLLRVDDAVHELREGQRQLQEGQRQLTEIRSLDARVTRLELNQRPPKPQT